MHADQVPIAQADDLPVNPQEEAAFQALAAADPAASATPAEKVVAFEWLRSVALDDDDPHREDAAALLYELARPRRVSGIDVTTSEDVEPVYLPTAQPRALAGLEDLLLLTVQRTHGSTTFPGAEHTETVSLVSREDLATSIRQIARYEDAWCAAFGPCFIRHRLVGVSSITLPVSAAELLELAGMEDLQALLSEVAA